MTSRALVVAPMLMLLVACSATSDPDLGGASGTSAGTGGASGAAVTGGASGEGGKGGASGATGANGASGGGIGGSEIGGNAGTSSTPTCAAEQATAEVFAHGASTLYRIDPDTLQLSTVGSLDCEGGGVIDIAIDRDGQMYGTAFGALLRIDKDTGSCTTITTGTFPNSLSFVPAGTVHPDKEALVGYSDAQYFEIDTTTGAMTGLGALGVVGLSSSGDIVSVIDGGTYLTVKGNECGDCLVKVNPANGQIIENLGDIGYSDVFGLAFWGGVVYGFTNGGEVFSYDVATKATALVQVTGASSYYGAGSSTCAPPDKIQ